MKTIIFKLVADLFGLADKVLPDGDNKLKFKTKIFELQAQLRNSKTIDNITYIIVINWFVGVPIKIALIADYMQTILFKADIVAFAVAVSFQFGIEFTDLLKVMNINRKEKKRSRK